MMQRSIKNAVSCSGVGLHTGRLTNLKLKSAPMDHGIVFVRTDMVGVENEVKASFLNVSDTRLCTIISGAGASIMTIEHIMAALAAHRINNVIIEIDELEVPALDGSSKCFWDLIASAGCLYQNAPIKRLKILKDISVKQGDKSIEIHPHDCFVIDFTISFAHKSIGTQRCIFDSSKSDFISDIGKARTFGFIEEIEMLKSKGLAKGASLENAVGVSKDGILNNEGLRYNDEFVRHKIIDCIGDLYLAGYELIGYVKAVKSGHTLNNKLLREIFSDESNYQLL